MTTRTSEWVIDGADGQPIYGSTDAPHHDEPTGVVLIVHGFLGYKDYGMFPFLARTLGEAGFVAHRFNLSHSGMGAGSGDFERPDLFERDTWNTQVFDITRVIDSVQNATLAGQNLPIVLLGHSRGGVSVLLCAGRRFRDNLAPPPAGVITLAAPSSCGRISDNARASMDDHGYYEVKSNRTDQTLRIGRAWLDEQREHPADHDLLALAAYITCPVLVAHGTADMTVPISDAKAITEACPNAQMLPIDGANHVLGAPNPLPARTNPPPSHLGAFAGAAVAFCRRVCGDPRA